MGNGKVRQVGRRSALELLRRIRAREVDPQAVALQERRVCVAYLRFEGYTQDEIAEIFAVHRRTITRDEEANRQDVARRAPFLPLASLPLPVAFFASGAPCGRVGAPSALLFAPAIAFTSILRTVVAGPVPGR